MEQTNHIKILLKIKDDHIKITDIIDMGSHHEILATLDYNPPQCHSCDGIMGKYDFQKPSKIPYLESFGYKTLIRLKKRRFRCKQCGKMAVATTSLVQKNCQIPVPVRHKIAQRLIEKIAMSAIAEELAISTSSVIRKLKEFVFKTDLSTLPETMSWDEFSFLKGRMSFVAQDFDTKKIIAILDGRTHAVIRNHLMRYSRAIRDRVQWITMDMFSPYYTLAKQLFPNAQIVLDRFHIVQHLNRAMNRTRIQIMNTIDRKTLPYRSIKRYWKLIQQDSRKLSHKRFYRPTFCMHLTNREVLEKRGH